jgi:replicative DNA helicase
MKADDFERGILGIVLLENDRIDLIASHLREAHFSLDSHRSIYRAMLKLRERKESIDGPTLCHEVESIGAVGGMAYLSDLTAGIYRFSESTVETYCENIRKAWKAREVERLGSDLELQAPCETADIESIISGAQSRLESIACDGSATKVTADDLADEVLESWEREHRLQSSPAIAFGIGSLDEAVGGMFPGHQIVVGARSGVGKTRFMVMATASVCAQGQPAQMNLIEPTRDEFMRGLAAFVSGVRACVATEPWQASKDERKTFYEAMALVRKWPLTIYDRANMTLDEIIARGRSAIRRGCRLIGVDYLQRVNIPSQEKGEQIRLRVARASTALANLVKDTGCTSLVLSQLRRTESMGIPTMQDLRESGQIENDAHTIILLHRDYDAERGIFLNTGAYVVPKRRFGPPANRRAYFANETATWENGDFNVRISGSRTYQDA